MGTQIPSQIPIQPRPLRLEAAYRVTHDLGVKLSSVKLRRHMPASLWKTLTSKTSSRRDRDFCFVLVANIRLSVLS